jgi:hypothetical protein
MVLRHQPSLAGRVLGRGDVRESPGIALHDRATMHARSPEGETKLGQSCAAWRSSNDSKLLSARRIGSLKKNKEVKIRNEDANSYLCAIAISFCV